MTKIRKYQGVKYTGDQTSPVFDSVTIEKPLQIIVNKEAFTVTMRTPGDDFELVRGLLFAEDVFSRQTIPQMEFLKANDDQLDTIKVKVPSSELKDGYKSARNFLSVSSCGVCGKTELPKLEELLLLRTEGFSNNDFQISHYLNGLEEMKKLQNTFLETGGCHGVAILDYKGVIISIKEDIGRHNAVDKVIGDLLIRNGLKDASAILVSGRISYEIIIKTFRARISTIVAVSAPSSLAIDYAKELGISLFGFSRGNKMTQYS
ncbi:MAG: FdhD protein [Parvicella sp.]